MYLITILDSRLSQNSNWTILLKLVIIIRYTLKVKITFLFKMVRNNHNRLTFSSAL